MKWEQQRTYLTRPLQDLSEVVQAVPLEALTILAAIASVAAVQWAGAVHRMCNLKTHRTLSKSLHCFYNKKLRKLFWLVRYEGNRVGEHCGRVVFNVYLKQLQGTFDRAAGNTVPPEAQVQSPGMSRAGSL